MKKPEIDIQVIRDDLSDLAKKFGRASVKNEEYIDKLKKIGFEDSDLTNNALVIASVFANAVQGDMKAVEKWQELTGTTITQEEKKQDEIGELLSNRQSNGKAGAVRQDRTGLLGE